MTFIKNQISLPELALAHYILLLLSDWSMQGCMTISTCKGCQENRYLVFQTITGGGKRGVGMALEYKNKNVYHGSPGNLQKARFWPIAAFGSSEFLGLSTGYMPIWQM